MNVAEREPPPMESIEPRWPIIVVADDVYVYTSKDRLRGVSADISVSEAYDADGYCVVISDVFEKPTFFLCLGRVDVAVERILPLENRAERLRERLVEFLVDTGVPEPSIASDTLCQLLLRHICGPQ